MTKIWTKESDYPVTRVALYDEARNAIDCFDLKAAKYLGDLDLLLFDLPPKGLEKIENYGVIWSDILIPLVSKNVRDAINDSTNNEDVQFIPVKINSNGKTVNGLYFLLNPLKVVDIVDHENSVPSIVKVSGFPDAKVGFKKMILRPDFPLNGIGRQHESLSYIVVGDQLAEVVLRATGKGVRFIAGLPPTG